MQTFNDLHLPEALLKSIADSGYTTPTPIQAQAIPLAVAGRDLQLSAQTGSGKTAAFVLPILTRLIESEQKGKRPRALILTPTRELALQVHEQVRKYGKELKWLFSVPLVGGAPYGGQIRALKKGVQIIIATPGRLLEALPETRQTIMSSATWDGAVGKIARRYTREPERIAIKVESAHIEEKVYFCDNAEHKNQILEHLVADPEMGQAIIFAATKRASEEIADSLRDNGFRARYLHGDLPQVKRNRIVEDLRKGKCDILVATDVAARGIDVPAISHVINYDLPRQVEDYVHRIGRSGRAGRTGTAINLCSLADRSQLSAITRYLERKIEEHRIAGLEPKITSKPKTKPGKKFRGAPGKNYGNGKPGEKKFDGKRGGKKTFSDRKGGDRSYTRKGNRV